LRVSFLSKFIVIKKNEDFQGIFEKGHSIYGRYLVAYFLHTSFDYTRFGLCVGKKIGNAVTRNHIKRLLREAVSATTDYDLKGMDILLVARNPILKASLPNIIFEITHILGEVNKRQTVNKVSEREGSQ
jgi:ribonuclease P protein component